MHFSCYALEDSDTHDVLSGIRILLYNGFATCCALLRPAVATECNDPFFIFVLNFIPLNSDTVKCVYDVLRTDQEKSYRGSSL